MMWHLMTVLCKHLRQDYGPCLRHVFLWLDCWIQLLHLHSYSTSNLNLSPYIENPPSIYCDLAFNLLLCIVLILLVYSVLIFCKSSINSARNWSLEATMSFPIYNSWDLLVIYASVYHCNAGVFYILFTLCKIEKPF